MKATTFFNKIVLSTVTLIFMLNVSTPILADEGPTNVNKEGYAIEGYDTVAYFTANMPVKGDGAFSYQWNYGKWLFSSQENLDLFKANPEKYAPQFGGWCAYAVAKDGFAAIEPDQFTIVDEKLYLNYNKRVNKKWHKKRDYYIEKGNNHWTELLQEALENVEG